MSAFFVDHVPENGCTCHPDTARTYGSRLIAEQAGRCFFKLYRTVLAVAVLLVCSNPVAAQDRAASQVESVRSSRPHIQLPAELDRVLRDYEAGWRANDEAALASLFAEDGFILRPRHKPVRGRANIEEAYKNSGGPLHLHAFHYEIADTVAYIIGGYRGAMDRPDAGKFILTLRKNEAGRWLITADMDNGNQ